jgi:hypothetical protein
MKRPFQAGKREYLPLAFFLKLNKEVAGFTAVDCRPVK